MNTVQNGKGDSPRNNWGPKWCAGHDVINWHRPLQGLARPSPPGRRPPAGSRQGHKGTFQESRPAPAPCDKSPAVIFSVTDLDSHG